MMNFRSDLSQMEARHPIQPFSDVGYEPTRPYGPFSAEKSLTFLFGQILHSDQRLGGRNGKGLRGNSNETNKLTRNEIDKQCNVPIA